VDDGFVGCFGIPFFPLVKHSPWVSEFQLLVIFDFDILSEIKRPNHKVKIIAENGIACTFIDCICLVILICSIIAGL
jgi:hypothetical protein